MVCVCLWEGSGSVSASTWCGWHCCSLCLQWDRVSKGLDNMPELHGVQFSNCVYSSGGTVSRDDYVL